MLADEDAPMADILIKSSLVYNPHKQRGMKLVINSELKSTCYLLMSADEDAPMADFLIGS